MKKVIVAVLVGLALASTMVGCDERKPDPCWSVAPQDADGGADVC